MTAPRDNWPHTAAILAGGASTRMGRPKERLALADGRSMIETVAAVAADVARSVVVLGLEDVLPGHRCIADLRAGQGPLAGIEALLASGIDDEYLVIPCDMPRIPAALLRELLVMTGAPATVLRVEGEERFRSLPARFSSSGLATVRTALDANRRAVHGVIEMLGPAIVEVPSSMLGRLVNVNTPAEFDAL